MQNADENGRINCVTSGAQFALAYQLRQNPARRFFAALADFAHRTHTARTTRLAGATSE
jgi:hypothetical protein